MRLLIRFDNRISTYADASLIVFYPYRIAAGDDTRAGAGGGRRDLFPHAFIRLRGTVDATGEKVDTNYGFTAVSVSPAILMGSVKGMIETKDAKYVSRSNPHFTLRLSDAEYRKLIDHVERWRSMPGKSYSLNKRNCVHFVMEAAALLGLSVNRKSKFFKKPKSFVLEMMKLNPALRL